MNITKIIFSGQYHQTTLIGSTSMDNSKGIMCMSSKMILVLVILLLPIKADPGTGDSLLSMEVDPATVIQ